MAVSSPSFVASPAPVPPFHPAPTQERRSVPPPATTTYYWQGCKGCCKMEEGCYCRGAYLILIIGSYILSCYIYSLVPNPSLPQILPARSPHPPAAGAPERPRRTHPLSRNPPLPSQEFLVPGLRLRLWGLPGYPMWIIYKLLMYNILVISGPIVPLLQAYTHFSHPEYIQLLC